MTNEEIQLAEKNIKDLATDAAERFAANNIKALLKTEVGSPESAELIKGIAQEALKSLKIKDFDGQEKALEVIVAELQKQNDSIAKVVKGLKDGDASVTKSFEAELKDQIEQRKGALETLKESGEGKINFTMKAAGTMMISNNYSGGTVGLTNFDPEFARIQRRQPFMRELVRVLTTDNMYIAWAEQKNADPGVAGTVAEGASKPQTDFDIVESTAKVEKIAVWIKVSKEALADIKFLQAEINTELRELVELKLDEQILSGDGNSPNLKGILPVVPTFAAVSTMALLVPTPNRFDVVMAAVAQIAAANFTADTVVLNPADFYSLQLVKDTTGAYIMPPFSSANGLTIAGLRVVANNGVTAGTFLVGDFKKASLAIREDVNIQVGYVNDDFTKNLVTILAEMRAVLYIKSNWLNAFVKGSFNTAITALTKP